MTAHIIGREGELGVVEAFLDRPGDGLSAIVLEGEPGIGKSTLWLAGVAAARRRSHGVLVSRPAETERSLANVVLGDLFGDVAPELLDRLPAPRRRALDSALLLREEPGTSVDPRALGVAIATLLPLLAEGRPLVLAIDDDQWLDPSSADTLRFALRRASQQPVLLLLSRRADGTPAALLEEAIDPAAVERLRVGPLSVGAIQLLLRRRLGITLPRPTLLRLHEVSGGNPFYALELARARTTDLARDGTVPLAVPANLDHIVGARLEGLDALTRRALLFVAAHGRMPVALLRAVEVAASALEPATVANVIETAGGVVRFTHPLLASAAYHGVDAEERRAVHRTLAAALDDPLDRGRHLALGADAPDPELAAVIESAAGVAIDRGVPIAAAELAEHALRLTPVDAVDDLDRRAIATARAYSAAGEGARARHIAADLAAAAPAGHRRAEALILRADLEPPDVALALLDDALAEAAGIPALEAAVYAGLAEAGRLARGGAWAERQARASLRLAERLKDEALLVAPLSILALVRSEHGDPDALQFAERAYRVAARLGDPRPVRKAGWVLGEVLSWSGTTEQARAWLERQLAHWGEHDELTRLELLWYLALVEFWAGRWHIASEYADELREIGLAYGTEVPGDHLPPALIALHRGQLEVAMAHAQRGLSLPGGQLLDYHVAVLGTCDLWSGSADNALVQFVEAERTADARGRMEPILRFWRAEYAEALLQLGRVDDATSLVAEWESAAERLGRERVLAQALRCRGLIAAARGDLSTALILLEAAVDRHDAVGDPFGRARALLALGVARRRARQKRSAREALVAALVAFEALGAASWVATTRAELGRIGGRTRIEGLSPSEQRVAELVADGRTNREIASALFLGERTVASHLTHIYAKLGIRSRTELATQLVPSAEPSAGVARNIPTS